MLKSLIKLNINVNSFLPVSMYEIQMEPLLTFRHVLDIYPLPNPFPDA